MNYSDKEDYVRNYYYTEYTVKQYTVKPKTKSVDWTKIEAYRPAK